MRQAVPAARQPSASLAVARLGRARRGDTSAQHAGERSESLRIGDVARMAGTTPRTIRYYEEIGLLPEAPARPAGQHRFYTQADVDRLREVMRLKSLLGVSLEELKTLLAAEEARAAVRAQLRRDDVVPERVHRRADELAKLEVELAETRKRVRRKIREADATAGGAVPPGEALAGARTPRP